MRAPGDCRDIEDVRQAIDGLDREIIGLIGKRDRYVKAAARFKTGEESVRAPERQKSVLAERRRWAEKEDLDPDVVEKIYRNLITYFVNREMEDWKSTER